MTQKHENYDLLNMIGYGLAKFDNYFVKQFGFKTKSAFYQFLVDKNVADTTGAVKNRQDMLDPFFPNPRKGWWQKKKQYIHRFILIDSLFGKEDAKGFSNIVKGYLNKECKISDFQSSIKPITQFKYRQMQETGLGAELFFMNNYELISLFKGGSIEDARLFGDGYDFQLDFADDSFYLAEVKGLKSDIGSVRFTEKEIVRAEEYKDNYFLVVVSNLIELPQFSVIENPLKNLKLKKQPRDQKPVIEFLSENIKWQPWKNNLVG